jgi:roadblock/LC7 domain-containing protein
MPAAWRTAVKMERPIGIKWPTVEEPKQCSRCTQQIQARQLAAKHTLRNRYVLEWGASFVQYAMLARTILTRRCAGNLQFVTKYGLSDFITYLAKYDANNPFGDNYNGANDDEYDDDGNNNVNYDDLPMCENGIGLGCADDGTFSLQYFDDSYCLKPSGKTYDRLKSLNQALRTYKNCAGIYYSGNNNNDGNSLPYYLISMSESCSSLDSGFCMDNTAMKDRRSHSATKLSMSRNFGGKTWVTKLKYASGGILLLSSFVMFTGILFTNRRRRRALLQRKYRQSRSDRSRKSKSRSKSKSRGESRKPSRSRSRAKNSGEGEGVFA